jgi:hypothetical protein
MEYKTLVQRNVAIHPQTQIIRLDGVILGKRIVRDGKVFLQVKDGDRVRSECRGTCFVEISLDELAQVLIMQ